MVEDAVVWWRMLRCGKSRSGVTLQCESSTGEKGVRVSCLW